MITIAFWRGLVIKRFVSLIRGKRGFRISINWRGMCWGFSICWIGSLCVLVRRKKLWIGLNWGIVNRNSRGNVRSCRGLYAVFRKIFVLWGVRNKVLKLWIANRSSNVSYCRLGSWGILWGCVICRRVIRWYRRIILGMWGLYRSRWRICSKYCLINEFFCFYLGFCN